MATSSISGGARPNTGYRMKPTSCLNKSQAFSRKTDFEFADSSHMTSLRPYLVANILSIEAIKTSNRSLKLSSCDSEASSKIVEIVSIVISRFFFNLD